MRRNQLFVSSPLFLSLAITESVGVGAFSPLPKVEQEPSVETWTAICRPCGPKVPKKFRPFEDIGH